MLRHSFIHADGIGPGTEAGLWARGARDWDAFLALHAGGRLAGARHAAVARTVEASHEALERRDAGWFAARLPNAEQWRLWEEFADRAAYVDIETTGLAQDADVITVIAMHAGGRTRTFVQGRDLDRFRDAIDEWPLVVTFNGATFDLPFLARRFRRWRPEAHLDLRYPLARMGHKGGLKAIERALGLQRPSHLREVDGWEAVRLWHRYEAGEAAALETLLEYARLDVENLPPLARRVADEQARALGFARRTCRWGAGG